MFLYSMPNDAISELLAVTVVFVRATGHVSSIVLDDLTGRIPAAVVTGGIDDRPGDEIFLTDAEAAALLRRYSIDRRVDDGGT